jgi:hypothetical protein
VCTRGRDGLQRAAGAGVAKLACPSRTSSRPSTPFGPRAPARRGETAPWHRPPHRPDPVPALWAGVSFGRAGVRSGQVCPHRTCGAAQVSGGQGGRSPFARWLVASLGMSWSRRTLKLAGPGGGESNTPSQEAPNQPLAVVPARDSNTWNRHHLTSRHQGLSSTLLGLLGSAGRAGGCVRSFAAVECDLMVM